MTQKELFYELMSTIDYLWGKKRWAKLMFQNTFKKSILANPLSVDQFKYYFNNSSTEVFSMQDKSGRTILHNALPYVSLAILNLILSKTPKDTYFLKDRNGDTPLHIAVKRSRLYNYDSIWINKLNEILKLVPINAYLEKNILGDTPLHIAATIDSNVFFQLTKYAPFSNYQIQNKEGFPPLHLAFARGSIKSLNASENHLKILDKYNFYCFDYCHDRKEAANLRKKAGLNEVNMDYIFVRGVKEPSFKNKKSPYNESKLDFELRKIFRESGKQTFTKFSTDSDGNKNRSVSMLGEDIMLFAHLGYGFRNPNLDDILTVAEYDHGSSTGKKTEIKRAKSSVIPQHLDTIVQMRLLKKLINTNKVTDCNELNVNITRKTARSIEFLFFVSTNNIYCNEPEYPRELRELLAIYMRRKYKNYLGKDLPLYEIVNEKGMVKIEYADRDTKDTNKPIKLLKKILLNPDVRKYMLSYANIDFWRNLGDFVKKDAKLKKAIEDYLTNLLNTVPNDSIHVSDIIKCMRKIAVSDSKVKNILDNWVKTNTAFPITLNYMNKVKDTISKLDSDIKSGSLDNNKPARINAKKQIVRLRGNFFMLVYYGIYNNMDKSSMSKFKKWMDTHREKDIGIHMGK